MAFQSRSGWHVVVLAAALSFTLLPAAAQPNLSGAAEAKLALERLAVTGSALMIAAHPDDENTALLAWLARGRNVRTSYLSLTRGEGGQNLVGPEQGALLGVIRTQELLSARRIDGAEQYFTRAIDFGFSKTAEETLAKWGRERVLGDIVWVIRRLQPDVIILRFSGTSRDGHGHHQSSALLGREAYEAAADPARFPAQLDKVKPWRARRLLFNMFSFNRQQEQQAAAAASRIELETGDYDPVLGYSFGEIAGISRSRHRSQGFGAAERRGSVKNYLAHVAGDPAATDLFDGVDMGWGRVPGGGPVALSLARALREFLPQRPDRAIDALLEARARMAGLDGELVRRKRIELDETIGLLAGLWLDASADRPWLTPGSQASVTLTALNRTAVPVRLRGVLLQGMAGAPAADFAGAALAYNQPVTRAVAVNVPADQPLTQPYWLEQPPDGDVYRIPQQEQVGQAVGPPVLRACFQLEISGTGIEIVRPVLRRYVDRVLGEQTRPVEVVPPVALKLPETARLFPEGRAGDVAVEVRANTRDAAGAVRLQAPTGWTVAPASLAFKLREAGEGTSAVFRVTPPGKDARGVLRAVAASAAGAVSSAMVSIDYPHIPPQLVFPPAAANAVALPLRLLARTAGYVMGAGDEVPDAIGQLGCQVTLLAADDLARGDLSRFDVIVTGVRAFNVRPDLRAGFQRLLDYVHQGGTLLVQYNVLDGGFLAGDPGVLNRIGPYPIRIGRDRVSVEGAPVRFPNPSHPLLHQPNEIGLKDFEGWIQERGLYFASTWDPQYQPLFESADPGEKPLLGATLTARYGKGAYVFTGLSFFRQLPAGVPGAYRIFANLLSAGKVIR